MTTNPKIFSEKGDCYSPQSLQFQIKVQIFKLSEEHQIVKFTNWSDQGLLNYYFDIICIKFHTHTLSLWFWKMRMSRRRRQETTTTQWDFVWVKFWKLNVEGDEVKIVIWTIGQLSVNVEFQPLDLIWRLGLITFVIFIRWSACAFWIRWG